MKEYWTKIEQYETKTENQSIKAQSLKGHYHGLIQLIKGTACTNISAKNSEGNLVLNQVKGKTRDIDKNFKKWHTKGAPHQKTFKLMKAIVSSKIDIGGHLKSIDTISYM